MDIFESGIPNIRIRKIGTKRNQLEIIETAMVLEAWDGYLNKRREFDEDITDGTIRMDFGCWNGDKSIDWQPQIEAYHYLLENQYAVRDGIIRALVEKFGWLKETYDWDSEDEPDVPNITPEALINFDFKPFIGPASVSFIEESRDGIAYLEWHFLCVWDPEHGLAAITHRDRLIDLDRGETDIWKIYEDKGTLAEELKSFEEQTKKPPPKSRNPWWKFW